jgi:hypothetical protein
VSCDAFRLVGDVFRLSGPTYTTSDTRRRVSPQGNTRRASCGIHFLSGASRHGKYRKGGGWVRILVLVGPTQPRLLRVRTPELAGSMLMPYLVQIGSIPENKTGVGSRGYHVYRRGTRVRVVWGPVGTMRGRSVKMVWERTTIHKDYRRSSERAAIALVKEIVAERLREGYSLLPVGARILRRAQSAFSTRRA